MRMEIFLHLDQIYIFSSLKEQRLTPVHMQRPHKRTANSHNSDGKMIVTQTQKWNQSIEFKWKSNVGVKSEENVEIMKLNMRTKEYKHKYSTDLFIKHIHWTVSLSLSVAWFSVITSNIF